MAGLIGPARLFLDECLSPRLVGPLHEMGAALVVHPRDHGGLGRRDDEVLARCLRDDLILATENARDFRRLVGREEVHPGLVVLPCVGRDESLRLLLAALSSLGADPMGAMVNRALEVSAEGALALHDLPPP